jgi:hypothetical protein
MHDARGMSFRQTLGGMLQIAQKLRQLCLSAVINSHSVGPSINSIAMK